MALPVGKRELRTLALAGGLGVLILSIYFLYIVGPLAREVVKSGRDLREIKAQAARAEALVGAEAATQEQYKRAEHQVAMFQEVFASEEELPAVIEWLSDLAEQTRLRIQTIFPQRVGGEQATAPQGPGPQVYKEIPIEVDALAGYHELGEFIARVESGRYPMRVGNLRINQSDKELRLHRINLLIRAFFSTASLPAPEARGVSGGDRF